MTEENRSKLKALEKIQAEILRFKVAQEYAEQAMEACIEEDYDHSEWLMDLARDTAAGAEVQRPAATESKKDEALN